MHSIRIIGPGRAGTSLAAALSARGWAFAGFLGRHDDVSHAAHGVDVLVISTPDDAVADVAALGAGAALTGPARRGDWATLSRHLDALPESERAGYQAGAALATRLAQTGAPLPAQPVTTLPDQPDAPVPAQPAAV